MIGLFKTREFLVEPFCSLAVCGVCLFGGRKNSEVDFLVFKSNSGCKFSAVFFDAFIWLRTVRALFAVSHILHLRCRPQIFPPVVRAFSVFVVDYFFGPLSSYVAPSQATGDIARPVNSYEDPSVGVRTACDHAPPSARRKGDFPAKNSGSLAVVQYRTQISNRERVARRNEVCFAGVSHSILLRSAWSEAVEGVTSAFLPRFYSREAV